MNRSKIPHPFLVTVFILLPLTGCDEGETPVAPVVDHIAPAVEWISPESGAELSGVIELAFSVYDEGGNLGISPSLVVNVRNGNEPPPEDHLPPDVWWTSPNPGSTLADTVRLRLGFFDEVGVDSVLLLKNGAAVVTIIPPCYCMGDSTNIPPYYCGGTKGGVTLLLKTTRWRTHEKQDIHQFHNTHRLLFHERFRA